MDMDTVNLIIEKTFVLLYGPLGGVIVGGVVTYCLTKRQNIQKEKREAYSAVISNTDQNFKFRSMEETSRILGKAITLAKPNLERLLRRYFYMIEVYKSVSDNMRNISPPTRIPQKWHEFEKFFRTNLSFRKGISMIETMMLKEIKKAEENEINTKKVEEEFTKCEKMIKESNVPLSF